MDANTREHLDFLASEDNDTRNRGLDFLMAASNQPVDWAYDAWDTLVNLMKTGSNHQRAIATTLLANLAKSDPKKRIL